MAAKIGKDCKVTLGSVKILGLGTWSITGVDKDTMEDSEFGDSFKTYLVGMAESGQITFEGYYDPADSTGQAALRTYWEGETNVTSLRLYVDNTSYWTPTTTTPLSHVNITAWEVNSDKSGLMAATFSAKISGKLELI